MNIPIIDMILRSGWVARSILVLLGIFSIITWAVIFNRMYYLRKVSKLSRLFIKKIHRHEAITDIETVDAQLLKSPWGSLV